MAIIGTQITIDNNGRFVIPSERRRIFENSNNVVIVLDDIDEIRRRVLIYSGKDHLLHLNSCYSQKRRLLLHYLNFL